MKLIDETGNQYGYLTVIERAENIGTRAAWKCKCGNETIVTGKLLRSGHTQSCGCLHKEKLIQKNMERGGSDLSGLRFGKLTVIGFDSWKEHSSGHKDRMWKCQCDCGNQCIINHRYLKNGDTSSCGCSKSRGNATINRLLNQYNIYYKPEYIFKDLLSENKGHMPFDFAIFDNNSNIKFVIEYQGSIHFFAEGNGWNTEEALINRKKRDKEKFDFCNKKGVKLYYITYLDNIEEKLGEILNEQGFEFN